MIDTRLLNLAHQAAQHALLPGAKLRAVPGSPLAYLVEHCTPNKEAVLATESLSQTLGLVCDKAHQPFALSGSPSLLLALGQIEEQFVKPILNQISFARNVVKPIIADLETSVNDLMAIRAESANNVALTIRKLYAPDAMYMGFGNHIAKHALVQHEQVGPGFKPNLSPDLSHDEIVERCRTNSEEINETLLELASAWKAYGEQGDLFEEAYRRVLLAPNEKIGSLQTGSYSNFMMATVAFVFADQMLANPQPGLGLNQSNLTTWVNFCRSACARVVQGYLNLLKSADSTGQLVNQIDRLNKTIFVYGRVYDGFDSPDRMDIMMGLLYKEGILPRTVAAIQEQAEDLKKAGQIAAAALTRTQENLRASFLTDAIQGAFVKLVEETIQSEETSDLRAFVPENEAPAVYRIRVAKFLEERYPGNRLQKTPLLLVLSDLVCELFFKETMAGVIMNRYVQIGLERPESSLATVNSLLVIEVLMEWFGGQIELITE